METGNQNTSPNPLSAATVRRCPRLPLPAAGVPPYKASAASQLMDPNYRSRLEGMEADWAHETAFAVFSKENQQLSAVERMQEWFFKGEGEVAKYQDIANNRRTRLNQFLLTKGLKPPYETGERVFCDIISRRVEHDMSTYQNVYRTAKEAWEMMGDHERETYEQKKRQLDETINTHIREDLAAEMAQNEAGCTWEMAR